MKAHIKPILLVCAMLYALCPMLSAQDIVPHRDIQKVDSLNRGKPTTAPVTVIKKGYSLISKADGRFYEQHLGRYIQDSLGSSLSNWTDTGGSLYPTENDTVYIPDTFPGGTGLLNLAGRLDLRYPLYSSTSLAIGKGSLSSLTTGVYNLAIGEDALYHITSRRDNTAIGYNALLGADVESFNTALGSGAGAYSDGSYCTTIGTGAGAGVVGSNNTLIGYNSGGITGGSNTTLGFQAGYGSTGDRNVLLGYRAGELLSGSDKLYIDNSTTSSPLLLGDFSANTLMINGKLGFTTQGSASIGLVGYDGSNYLTRPTLGPGLAFEDNALTLTGMGSDSIYTTDTTVCFIVLGDTTCVLLDSSYTTDSTYCYIFAGDTTCIEYNVSSGNIYTMDGTLTGSRNVNTGNHAFKITRGGVNVLRIPQPGVSASIQFELLSNSDIFPLIQMTNDGSGDNYIHFNDFNDEDYSLGVDASEDAFYISGGSALGADPMMYFSHVRDSIVVFKDIQLNALLLDEDGDAGSVGDVATATATGFNWAAAGGGTYTASEGLTMTGSDITLGGTITTARTITTSSISDYVNFNTATASVTPLLATATNGSGILASNTSTAGALRGTTTNGYGLHAQSTSAGRAAKFESDPSSTNSVHTMLDIWRRTSSTAADGIGVSTEYQIEADNGTLYRSNTLEAKWTTAANATRTSQFVITGVNSASSNDIIYFEGDKRTRFNGRAQTLKGADVSSAGDLTLGVGNVFHITGTTTINAITTTDWQAGSEVTLIFDASVTVKNNTAGGGSTAVMRLGGGADFAATARDVLKLVYDGTEWFEITRSAN